MDYVYSDKTKCCGCAACARSCLTGAIVMLADAEGFIYPKINKTQCVDCGLCHKVCPYIDNEVVENFHPHYKCYAATHKDRAVLERSSSGGVFTALSDIILEQDGAVYGCGYTEQLKAIHMRATSTTERDNLCGSKYVQSEIDDSFIYVRDDLRNGLHVLFMGTPCQIAGLLLFLYGENTSNLLTVSLICHGVPSPKLFAEYLDYCNKRRNAKIVEYHHRSKNNYWAHIECSKFVYNNGDSDSDSDSLMSQAWKQLFYTNAPLRPCCYECPWAKSGHVSDMTIGDFWGIEDVMPDFYNRMGVSAVLINTEKGEMAFECIKGKLEFREATFESMTVKNSNLIEPSISLTDREIFWGIYHEKGFGTLIWKYGCINYYYQFRRLIKNILKAIGVWEKG